MVLHLALAWEPLWLLFAASKGSSSTVCQQMRYVHTLHNKMEVTGIKVRSHTDTTSAVWVAKEKEKHVAYSRDKHMRIVQRMDTQDKVLGDI